MTLLSSRSPCFISGFVSKNPLFLLPCCLSPSLSTLLPCSAVALLFATPCAGEEKAPGCQLDAQNFVFLICPDSHQIVPFHFPQYFLWLSCHSHLLLQIICPFFHCLQPFLLHVFPSTIILSWRGEADELLALLEQDWAGDTATVTERIRKKTFQHSALERREGTRSIWSIM